MGNALDPDDPVVMAVNALKAKVSKDVDGDAGRGNSGLRSLASPQDSEWPSAESSEGFSSGVHYGKHLVKMYDTSGESDASSSSY